ncbi:MAG: methylmalonyl-CoA mutase family protein [Bacteriovoracaceae bacterium]
MSLDDFFTQNFNTQRDQWEKSLRTELKIDDVGLKSTKKSAEGAWPTLSLEARATHQLRPLVTWKKAAQTYVKIPTDIDRELDEDLANGVRVFFFEKDFLTESQWKKIATKFSAFKDAKDLVVVLLGDNKLSCPAVSFRIIDEDDLGIGRGASAPGGNNVQELALMTLALIERSSGSEVHAAVFLDSQFFKNIAKIRAARLLAEKVVEVSGQKKKIYITGLTSYRDWTLYERYSNMLRNNAAVASGYIGGCDYVQSSGYQSLMELETDAAEKEHEERSRRLSRNTGHILSLESTLGIVEDASYGSYHLESLTEEYAREAWALMQKLVVMKDNEISDYMMSITTPVREERMKKFATRKHVLAGVNDFPDLKDTLSLKTTPKSRFFRTARVFEELRLRMENATKRPEVYLGIYGDYGALHARINFVVNYFELAGLKVNEPGRAFKDKAELQKNISGRTEEFLVLVAADDQYQDIAGLETNAREKYLAGKTELPGYTNVYAGQNVLEVLNGIVERWGKK